ncbi:MAG: TonB-dependent receptor [Novosphingobium sp.]|nr:TonB-dependent receptor [Novosphingobium sp.]MCP5402817.1 TonB-dependent receptor [Novosphingobium sp.]
MRPFILPSLLLIASPALAQEPPLSASAESDDELEQVGEEILVVATRIRGQVDTDQPPVMTLDEADVAAYGASSIGELLEAVSPQTNSGRGRGDGHPVILLNGQRISSFRQLRNIPPEAIRRMEVLPEEVALRFGYPPDQRLVNFILKENFYSIQAAGEYNMPTRGGFAESELEAGLTRIDGPRRLNLNWKMEDTSLLTEAERDVVQEPGTVPTVITDPDPAAYRSLVADSVTHTINGSWSTGLGQEGLGGTLTLDGLVSRADSRSLSGLDTVLLTAPDGSTALRSLGDPLVRDNRVDSLEGGVTLNKPLGDWQLTATADAKYSESLTRIDRRADVTPLVDAAASGDIAIDGPLPPLAGAGVDAARSEIVTVSTFASLAGRPFSMPAGDASLTVDAGYDRLSSTNRDSRGTAGTVKLDRDIFSAGANLALPLLGGRNNFLGTLGDVSLNLSGSLHEFSDFGTLTDWSAGIVWSPTEKLTLNASYIVSEVAPSLGQLGNPGVLSFNVPVYDFTRGETALVTIVGGGNPDLLAEKQRDIKLSLNYDLPLFRRSSLQVEYFRNRSDDVTRSFPLLTPAVEAAFPDRVLRDAEGRLVSIDRRPVTFDEVEGSRMRWGINLSGRIASEQAEEARGGARGQGAGRPGGGGRPPGFGRHGQGGRWNLSVYHTWRFTDRVTIAPGALVLDQLDGDSLVDGGVPRHSVEMEGGAFYKGFGLRLNGNWTAPATVRASGAPGSSDLRFGSTFVLDARFFVNLDQQEKLVAKMPFLKGVRIAFDFENIFDSRQKVTDESGLVPLSYQADFLDPRGRFVGIDIRKRF